MHPVDCATCYILPVPPALSLLQPASFIRLDLGKGVPAYEWRVMSNSRTGNQNGARLVVQAGGVGGWQEVTGRGAVLTV